MRASQVWRFFCVVSPGHEASALEEFHAKRALLGVGDATPEGVPGGFEVELPWERGRGLAHALKIPTRVVVRLETVTARDFPKLFQKLAALPWNQWLKHPRPELRITAHQCRLMHTGRVEETLRDALAEASRRQPFPNRWEKENLAPDLLLVRGEDDAWTLSLDLAGEPLYKRGMNYVKGEAPMRETHAAACLWELFKNHDGTPVDLVDPMCGSGTFLWEALTFHLPSERAFAYTTSPLDKGVAPWKPLAALPALPVRKAWGLDRDGELLGKLRVPPGLSMEFHVHDLLDRPYYPPAPGEVWVVSNPPYGERLALAGGIPPFAQKLSAAIGTYRSQRCLLVVPRDWPPFKIPGLPPASAYAFSNGGLAVEARLFQRQNPPVP